MRDQPPSEGDRRSGPHWIGVILASFMAILFFQMGIEEISKKDGLIIRKGSSGEHVTGDAAVNDGISKLLCGAFFLGVAIWNCLRRSSGSSSEKTQYPSAKTRANRRDVGGKQSDQV